MMMMMMIDDDDDDVPITVAYQYRKSISIIKIYVEFLTTIF